MSEIYLNTIIKKDFIDQMPGNFLVSDLKSKFLIANKMALKVTGFNSYDSMINATYHDMPCKAAEQHDVFCQSDKIIADRDKNIGILGCYHYAAGWKILLGEKYPLHDTDGNLIAIAQYFNDVTNTNVIDLSKIFKIILQDGSLKISRQQITYVIEENYPEISLPARQSECLFFLIRGKTAKEIAKILNLSYRTVEYYIEELKLKLNCYRKSELIEKAIVNGYMNIIPKSLFRKII